jgi:hypothetical protein
MVEEMLAARAIVISHETVRSGRSSSAKPSRTRSDRGCRASVTSGTSKKSSSKSLGRRTGCGAPSTSTASCWMFWFRAGVMRKLPRGCCASWWCEILALQQWFEQPSIVTMKGGMWERRPADDGSEAPNGPRAD